MTCSEIIESISDESFRYPAREEYDRSHEDYTKGKLCMEIPDI